MRIKKINFVKFYLNSWILPRKANKNNINTRYNYYLIRKL